MGSRWDVSQGITGNVPHLGGGRVADQRVAPRTSAPRKTSGAGGRGHGAGIAAGRAPETENEPGAPGAGRGGGREAETGGGRAAEAEPGGPALVAPARAVKRMKRLKAKRRTPWSLYLKRKRLKRRKKMKRLRIKTLTRTNWRRR